MLASRQETADLVTITKEILNGKLHFLCSVESYISFYSDKLLKTLSNISNNKLWKV